MNDNDEDLILSKNLEILQEQIELISDKIKNGKIKDIKKEELRIKLIRTLCYLCKTHADIKEKQELEELRIEVEDLKESIGKL
ncbi:MAG: hypothetical protein ABSE83_08925 [Methanobacterium sp.]|jgi:hypothetical protein